MSARVYRTASEEDTIDLGRQLATQLVRPCLILSNGQSRGREDDTDQGNRVGARSSHG